MKSYSMQFRVTVKPGNGTDEYTTTFNISTPEEVFMEFENDCITEYGDNTSFVYGVCE